MGVDLAAAAAFMARHARVLDRRRFEFLLGATSADAVFAAVDAYRNPDGGYGWGIEPDLRAPESQPAGALHALEAFADVAPATTPHAAQVCDWLDSITLPDGGLPFALPVADTVGSACAQNGAHPWLDRAIGYGIEAVRRLDGSVHAIELCFAVRFLDAAHDRHPEAPALLERLGAFIPDDGLVPVAGGSEGEVLRPLDFAPVPGPARRLYRDELIAAELNRLADAQHDDGGWSVDFASYSPAAELEWRGYQTVHAVSVLLRNGVISPG